MWEPWGSKGQFGGHIPISVLELKLEQQEEDVSQHNEPLHTPQKGLIDLRTPKDVECLLQYTSRTSQLDCFHTNIAAPWVLTAGVSAVVLAHKHTF